MFILGSTSPRRIELFKKISEQFDVISPSYDEDETTKTDEHFALKQALGKLNSLKNKIKYSDCLITCDTIVYLNGKIYGKPKNHEEAFSTLKELSGKTHQVISGYSILYKDKIIQHESKTDVTFNLLNDSLIEKYIKETNVYDKAGSYAAQDDKGYNLINKIEGSFYNVMGFPLEDIIEDLKTLNLIKK